MSERLSDERVAAMTIMSVPVESKRFSRETVLDVRALATELRERRLSDQRGLVGMTAEDKEALRWLVRHVNATTMPGVRPRRDKAAALAVLDRLLKDPPMTRAKHKL